MGRGAIVIGLAAVIIGKVVFEKVFHNFALKLLSVVLGAVIYYAVLQVVDVYKRQHLERRLKKPLQKKI